MPSCSRLMSFRSGRLLGITLCRIGSAASFSCSDLMTPWPSWGRAAFSMLLPLRTSSVPKRHLPSGLNINPGSADSSSVNDLRTPHRYTIRRLQGAFQPCHHDSPTPNKCKFAATHRMGRKVWSHLGLHNNNSSSPIPCI
jgi:hypothetical protein